MGVRVWTTIGVLVVAGAVVATAQERLQRQGRPDPAAIATELGLSADQAAQLKKLRIEGRKQAIRQRADMAIARVELAELMEAPTVDEKAVAAKAKAISDLQAAALKARIDERLAMRKLLSPEQQEKLKQLLQQGRRDRGPRAARGFRNRQPGPRGPWSDEGGKPPVPEPPR